MGLPGAPRPWRRLSAGDIARRERAMAYGVMGRLAGAGIAVGPLLGG